MSARRLVQRGWISGPVDCHCSGCFWASSFDATDASVPDSILNDFQLHSCEDYQPPRQFSSQRTTRDPAAS